MENSSSEIQFLKERYSSARNKFKPREIRILLLAEGPPDSLDRHFYFEDVKIQDSLFLEIMGILYPELKKQYLASGRVTELKLELLQMFQEDGFFLLDLAEVPCSLLEGMLEEQVPLLLNRLPSLIDNSTPVILIKASVYDLCYAPLIANGYFVHNDRIPFPGSGQQRIFREKFSKAIALY
ncbi:MAG TPA: hypothetical protein VGN63_00785 [Flavisolibacter sp.]|jgi:hypothetical protein|nr:hypothetical protein [Flavisolibacter sp.]